MLKNAALAATTTRDRATKNDERQRDCLTGLGYFDEPC